MKLLIWVPLNVKGGGHRLFVNLVNALSKHREICSIKIVLSPEWKENKYLGTLTSCKGVTVCYYPDENLFTDGGKIQVLENKIKGLKNEINEIERRILEKQEIIANIEHEIKNLNFPAIYTNKSHKKFTYRIIDFFIKIIFSKKIIEDYIQIVKLKRSKIEKEYTDILKLNDEFKLKADEIKKLENEKEMSLRDLKEKEIRFKHCAVDYYAKDCDVVFFFWPHFIDFQKTNKPSVCTFQDVVILDFPENIGGTNAKVFFENSKRWLTGTTVTVTSSHYIRSRLLEFFNMDPDLIHVIPHRGFVMEGFQKSDSSKVKEKFNLPEEYIVYPANLGFHKNHYNLFIAFSRFKYREKYPLVLFGNFTEYIRQTPPDYPDLLNCARLTALINRLGLKHGRDFFSLGFIEDEYVQPIIENAKFLIMPSLAEGGGSYPVEEALRIGVPVACSDIPVMKEHLENRTAKIAWFDPESTDSITNAMNNLIENYDEYKQSVIKGLSDPVQSWEDIAESYVKIFKIAIEKFYKDQN